MLKKIFKLFTGGLNQNELLIKNMNAYAKKTKAKQQESQVSPKGSKRRAKRNKKSINV